MSKRLDTTEFIRRARLVHGDRYDYSKAEYKTNAAKVIITCSKHGEFWQSPHKHWLGQGCPDCAMDQRRQPKFTTKDFTKRAIAKHGKRYDYSQSQYTGADNYITIICLNHGDFQQTARSHLSGAGCSKCSGNVQLTTDQFIKRAKQVHGRKFDYSATIYVKSTVKVEIACPKHGPFWMLPHTHLSGGTGCPVCGDFQGGQKRALLAASKFTDRAREVHGDNYDYSQVKYEKSSRKVQIVCPKHGVFKQTPNTHLRGRGCKKCGVEKMADANKKTELEFIEKSRSVHGSKYDYSLVNYTLCKNKVIIICPAHGKFKQAPTDHTSGKGCPACQRSLGEEKVAEVLDNLRLRYIPQYKFPDCVGVKKRRLIFDFAIIFGEKIVLIEYDGRQHYEPLDYFGGEKAFLDLRYKDQLKTDYARANNIPLLRIPFWQFDEIEQVIVDWLDRLNQG